MYISEGVRARSYMATSSIFPLKKALFACDVLPIVKELVLLVKASVSIVSFVSIPLINILTFCLSYVIAI